MKGFLKNKNNERALTPSNIKMQFKTYLKQIENLCKNQQTDQWNELIGHETDYNIYSEENIK